MGRLKQAGKLEQAFDSACESWLAKSPNEAYIAAKNGRRHADLIPKFSVKSIKEIEKSIRSYEKLIVEHKDKIANGKVCTRAWRKYDRINEKKDRRYYRCYFWNRSNNSAFTCSAGSLRERNEKRGKELEKELISQGVEALFIKTNVSSSESVKNLI